MAARAFFLCALTLGLAACAASPSRIDPGAGGSHDPPAFSGAYGGVTGGLAGAR